MEKLKIFLVFIMCLHYGFTEDMEVITENYSTESEILPVTTDVVIRKQPNKTLTELVKEQTDAIKKIISLHKPPKQDYISATNTDDEQKASALKAEKEKQFIEELRLKCKYFQQTQTTTTTTTKPTVIPFGPPIKPEFLQYKPQHKPEIAGNYFIFAQNPANLYGLRANKLGDKLETAASEIIEDKVSVSIDNNPAPVDIPTTTTTTNIDNNVEENKLKYVKLEPLVLQKTMLTNGKTLFYWYRTLQNTQKFVQVPDTAEYAQVDTVAQPQNQDYQSVPLPEQYQYLVDPNTGTIMKNNKPSTTTPSTITTATEAPQKYKPQFFINPQTGLIYQTGYPNQFIYHRRAPDITTTTTTTTTTEPPKPTLPNYTIDYSEADKPTENYQHQYRFVVPMMVTASPDVAKYPYQIDPYSYLPKNQQPNLMNIAVPYMPNYHIIRTLSIPKKYQEITKNDETKTN